MARIVDFPSGEQFSSETWIARRPRQMEANSWKLVVEAFDTWKSLAQAKTRITGDTDLPLAQREMSISRLGRLADRAWERYMRRTDAVLRQFQQLQMLAIQGDVDSEV